MNFNSCLYLPESFQDMLNKFAASPIELKVTPDKLKAASTGVKDANKKLKQDWDSIYSLVTKTMAAYWECEIYDSFKSYCGTINESFELSCNTWKDVSDRLEKIAGVYEKAETKVDEEIETLPADVL